MQFHSLEALKQDIRQIDQEIARLFTQRDTLVKALAVVLGERSTPEAPPQPDTPSASVARHAESEALLQRIAAKLDAEFSESDSADAQEDMERQRHEELAAGTPEEPQPSLTGFVLPSKPKRKSLVQLNTKQFRNLFADNPDKVFTTIEVANHFNATKTGVRPHLDTLLRQKIIVAGSKPREDGGHPHKTYQYNSDLPPAPTERPKEPTPESQLVGPVTRGGVVSNGRIKVPNKIIQSFIDQAITQGWTVEWKDQRTQGGHLKFKSPTGQTVGVNPKATPRIAELIKRDLKRSGLRL
jgi:chorismate mutase